MATDNRTTQVSHQGVTLGCVMAAILSYAKWKSFWWMFLHGILGWLYIIYYYLIAGYGD
jgi:uncharacterized membrane protein YjjB (DUF3815 family)